MKRKMTVAFVLCVAIAALTVAAGCSSTSKPTTVKSTPHPLPVTGGNGAQVTIIDFAFQPASLTVAPGTTVTWTNAGAVAHTVTGDTWGSGQLQPGMIYSYTFSTAGTYAYHCSNHPTLMNATVVVKSGGSTGGGTGGGAATPVSPTPVPGY